MMKKRLLCLLLAVSLLLGSLPAALAEAQHAPFTPGALTRALFLEAFQNGDAVCADLGCSLTLNAEALGLTGEDSELLHAIEEALYNAQITVAAVKTEGGLLLELDGVYFEDDSAAVCIDVQLEITQDGLELTSAAFLPGECVTLSWEAALAMLGLGEEESAQLLALRGLSPAQLGEAIASSARLIALTAQQIAAPYGQTIAEFIAAQPVSVEEHVAAEGYFPAAAKETAVIITEKAFGELITALCSQLEQDAALVPILDALLALQEDESLTTAALCAELRAEAQAMMDEEYPLYLVTGTDDAGRIVYGSLCITLEDGSTAALNLVNLADAPEDGLCGLLQAFMTDAQGVYSGLTASIDYTVDPADPQVISLSAAADIQSGEQSLLDLSFDAGSEPILTEEGMSGYNCIYSYVMTIPDEGSAVTISCYGESEYALTAEGGERAYSIGDVEIAVDHQTVQQTSTQTGFVVFPGENGPEAEYFEQQTAKQDGIDEAIIGAMVYTVPYEPSGTPTEFVLDNASEEEIEALCIRALTNVQAQMDALFALLPEPLLTLIAGEPAEEPASITEAQ
ncbi:MAG: hypothetical protein ACI4MM_07970 [Candidatus Ventricola sp.]